MDVLDFSGEGSNGTFIVDAARTARLLAGSQLQETHDVAVKTCQVFSGIFFTGLAIWLSFTNGTKLSFIQQAALEKRLTVCCFLGVYVGSFSAFFNFFQLTEVDNFMLDRQSSFTLDFSRPLEWMMTCPLMQLSLVLMGGSRIPEYRRALMPGLSLATLISGTVSMLVTGTFVFVAYGVGMIFCAVMFYLNRVQILEHSNGQECLLYGDSEFRKATILLIATWFPFTAWYALSPEGFGLLQDVLIVQVGWAFLNIVAKFSFIFYIQRIKDNYCSRLKVKREFYSAQNSVVPQSMVNADGSVTPPYNSAQKKKDDKQAGELGAIVVETMNFLGMAQNSERFLRLLHHCDIHSVEALEKLTPEECVNKQLPSDLVSAVQKRLKVWRLEMQDMAELALEQGEMHYAMEEPVKMQAVSDRLQTLVQGSSGTATPILPGQMGAPPPPAELNATQSAQLSRLEDMMISMQQQQEMLQMEMRQKMHDTSMQMSPAALSNAMQSAIAQALQAQARMQEQEVEGGLRQRMEEIISLSKDRLDQTIEIATSTMRSQAKDFQESVAREAQVIGGLEDRLRKVSDEISKAAESSRRTMQDFTKELKGAGGSSNRQEELERVLTRKIEDQTSRICDRSDRTAEHLRASIQTDMTTVINRTDMVSEVVKESSHSIKENITDLRRISMNIIDNCNGTQDTVVQVGGRVQELRGALDASIDRVLTNISDLREATQHAAANNGPSYMQGEDQGSGSGLRPASANATHGHGGLSTSRSRQSSMVGVGGMGRSGLSVLGA
eukprot:TRINITY_DN22130_c0_g3_i1.p1 TRINITY_DN22130_c0_g3~~TRINITY_DN22130_c0_g3_i1.p1  ORF type:complete len:781 (-),score=173.96 TRINITY_DN22130_c0_g3_i1:49-2391(-)